MAIVKHPEPIVNPISVFSLPVTVYRGQLI
jgi:hypothetical protein